MSILRIEKVSKRFSGLMALSDVSFNVDRGVIQALIGPNGAGKTTLFQMISGILPTTSGRILFDEKDITNRAPHDICVLGIGRTFQLIRLFPNMTVLENVMTGRHSRMRTGVFMSGFRLPGIRKEEKVARQEAQNILEFMGLKDKAHMLATSLPYGQQRLVEIARALASKPRLLMLDEPAAGMTPAEGQVLAERILELKENGLTILLVEHDMELVMDISDRIMVLNYGRVIAEGPSEVIQKDPKVIEAYLGTEADHA